MEARTNPSLPWMAAGALLLAGGFFWYRRRNKAGKDLRLIDDYAKGVNLDEVTTEAGAQWAEDPSFESSEEGWVEEDESAPVPVKATVPESKEAAAVLSDPDPAPQKERTRFQVAIRLAKHYVRKKTKKPGYARKFDWKSKRARKGRMVLAVRKSDGAKLRFLVKPSGRVVRLKKVK